MVFQKLCIKKKKLKTGEEAPAQDSTEPEEETLQLAEEAAAVPAEEEETEAGQTQEGNPPATVSTVDSRAEGITLNLFDYDLTDDSNAAAIHLIEEILNWKRRLEAGN